MPWNNRNGPTIIADPVSSTLCRCLVQVPLACCLVVAAGVGFAQTPSAQRKTEVVDRSAISRSDRGAINDNTIKPVYRNESLRGRVAWLADALKDQFGITSVPEVARHSLAIVTSDGQVVPLVENLRGRAFRKDERLRDIDMEILVRRHEKQPLAQVLRIFEVRDGKRYEIDYWCDVCAIPMYETGPCSCCQDDNRLRKRLVADDDPVTLDSPAKR